jgi:hypothetical protein
MRGEKQKTSWVYVVAGVGEDRPCKIGITFNLHRRMRELQTSADKRLEFAHKIETERGLAAMAERRAHRRLADRHRSGEWYDVTRDEAWEAVQWAVNRTQAKRDERAARIEAEDPTVKAAMPADGSGVIAKAESVVPVKRPRGKAAQIPDDAVARAIAEGVLERMAEGMTLTAALASTPSAPSVRTWCNWMENRFSDLLPEYRRARALLADRYVDRIITVIDDTVAGSLDPNAARVAIDGLRWTASKLAPREYGDRIDISATTTQTVQVGYVIDLSADRAALPADVTRMIDVTPVAVDDTSGG